jgi:hypothetical protein
MPENFPEVKYSSIVVKDEIETYYRIRSEKLYNIFDLGFFWGIYRASMKSCKNNSNANKPTSLKLVKIQ